MIRFGRDVCADLPRALAREWLDTNGIGGFASSTIAGLNSRRYHGLLVAATRPPLGRMVLLSKFEETLVVDGQRVDLSTNQYPGVVHPDGYRHQIQFRLDPFPVSTYRVGRVELEKTVFMVHGENATVIQYAVRDAPDWQSGPDIRPGSLVLEVRPLVAFRDYHALTHRNDVLDPHVQVDETSIALHPYSGLPSLHISHGDGHVTTSGCWYHQFEYDQERQRGLDFAEDLYNPCVLTFDLRRPLIIVASTRPVDRTRVEFLDQAERKRRRTVAPSPVTADDPFVRTLAEAADRFIVGRGHGSTVIAGYHWFSDWGRDTMVALPGLTLATGRPDVAREILRESLQHADRGMIPNRFPDAGAPEYTSADATLWFFHAVQMFLACGGDDAFVRASLYEGLRDIVGWHVRGTRYGIRVDEDGLLTIGTADAGLTWMDVKIGDRIVTPRSGKPVEIQALWYNALRFMEQLATRYGDVTGRAQYGDLAARAQRSFDALFWNPVAGCLYDVVDGATGDGSIRPNQVIALSVPFTPVSDEKAVMILDVVERELLTPYGLRTLAASDRRYCGRYDGDARSRDAAYHQGTVWPWLLGPFVTAYVRAHRTSDVRAIVDRWLEPLRRYVLDPGVGQIPELFDGDPPHRAGGCIAQAWSVGELLRVTLMMSPGQE